MGFKRILIPIDGSPVSFHAAKVGVELAQALDAEVATLFVVEPPVAYSGEIGIPAGELLQLTERDDEAIVEALRQHVVLPPAASHLVRVGHPADVIDKTSADWAADLIVIGSHGRSGLGRVLLGSVAEAVLRRAPCPVLVVRGSK
jgi:nucleotide-binding universal stress UspA family protein